MGSLKRLYEKDIGFYFYSCLIMQEAKNVCLAKGSDSENREEDAENEIEKSSVEVDADSAWRKEERVHPLKRTTSF